MAIFFVFIKNVLKLEHNHVHQDNSTPHPGLKKNYNLNLPFGKQVLSFTCPDKIL